jgi:hypothetical protein
MAAACKKTGVQNTDFKRMVYEVLQKLARD